jgi:hypothetical protein
MPTITSKADTAGKDGSELQSNKLPYLELDDDSSVRLGARPDCEHALAGRRVSPTGTLEEAWPPQRPDHVAQQHAKRSLVPVTSVQPASD